MENQLKEKAEGRKLRAYSERNREREKESERKDKGERLGLIRFLKTEVRPTPKTKFG